MEQLSFLFNEAETYCAPKPEAEKTAVAAHAPSYFDEAVQYPWEVKPP